MEQLWSLSIFFKVCSYRLILLNTDEEKRRIERSYLGFFGLHFHDRMYQAYRSLDASINPVHRLFLSGWSTRRRRNGKCMLARSEKKSAGEEERIETKWIDAINSDVHYKFHGGRSSDFTPIRATPCCITRVIGEWHQGRRNNALWTTSTEEVVRINGLKHAWKRIRNVYTFIYVYTITAPALCRIRKYSS